MPNRRPHARALLAGALTLASACGPRNRAGSAGQPGEPALVIFSNQSLYEAAVYAVPRGGTQVRIGTVQPGRTDTLTVRSGSVPVGTSVTLVARLLASRQTPTTGPLTLQAGDRIAVTLPSEANVLNVLPAP